jgi:hypothetical protein
MLDIPHDLEQRRELFQRISPGLKFELKLQDVVTRCCIAAAQNGLRNMSSDQERSLDTLINLFQAQVASVGLEYATELQHLYVLMSALIVQAFALWKSPTAQDPTALYDLCASACQVLEKVEALEKARHICLPATNMYFIYTLMVSTHVLLRCLKTSFNRYVDVERAKSALFLGIGLHKRMSVQNNDVPARNGLALTQLWSSERAFKRPNGTEASGLRVRSRLTGSIVLDGVVWWREEFGGFMGVYPPPIHDNRNGESLSSVGNFFQLIRGTDEASRNAEMSLSSSNPLGEPSMTPVKHDFTALMDDPMLAEFGWTDDLFSSMWNDSHIPTI